MPIKYIIFITQKLGVSDQNGLQIRILHRKIHRIKEKTSFFYMTLKLKNSENFKQIENLKTYFEEHSKLSFTYEIESCKELSFLDTIIRNRNKEQLRSAIHSKPTNIGECLITIAYVRTNTRLDSSKFFTQSI